MRNRDRLHDADVYILERPREIIICVVGTACLPECACVLAKKRANSAQALGRGGGPAVILEAVHSLSLIYLCVHAFGCVLVCTCVQSCIFLR